MALSEHDANSWQQVARLVTKENKLDYNKHVM